jgi:hypothetical protein
MEDEFKLSSKWETTLVIKAFGRQHQVFNEMEDNLILLDKWKTTSSFYANGR